LLFFLTFPSFNSRLLSSSSLDPDDSDYDEDEHGTRKKSKFRAALPQVN